MEKIIRFGTLIAISSFVFTACATLKGHGISSSKFTVTPYAETAPIGMEGDAADDPAIWVSKDKQNVRLLGTQKKGGIYVFDLNGKITQEILGTKPNNIDILNNFSWPDGKIAPIVVTSDRLDNTIGVFRFDEETMSLETSEKIKIPTGFAEVYGICIGSLEDAPMVIATSKSGTVAAFSLISQNGGLASEIVAKTDLGSIAEGCVIDSQTSEIFLAQEDVAIHRGKLAGSTIKTEVFDKIGNNGLTPDLEGLAIYNNGSLKLLVSSVQGINRYALYDLNQSGKFLGMFAIAGNEKFDGVSETDGLDVNSTNMGQGLESGILVVQDDNNTNPQATQNFKIVSFANILKLFGL